MSRDFWTVDAATQEELELYTKLDPESIAAVVETAGTAFQRWRESSVDARSALLRAVAAGHRRKAHPLANLMAREMGKPLEQALQEIELSASIYDYYADRAAELLAPERLSVGDADEAEVRVEPIGVVFGVMPWNYPVYQVARLVAPNLLLGNALVVKHAQVTTGTSLLIESIIRSATDIEGLYCALVMDTADVERVIEHPLVQGVSLTGSEQAGAAVAAIAGRHLKRCVLELGGNDPFIVLPGADIHDAVSALLRSRLWNAGQSCNAAKRVLLHGEVFDEFVSLLVRELDGYRIGDPLDTDTKIGPLASLSGKREVVEQIEDARRLGARFLYGADFSAHEGAFLGPVAVTDVTPEMRISHEEVFGPLIQLARFDDVDAAVEAANDSKYGLGATVFADSDATAMAVGERLESGMCGVNRLAGTHPHLPFGGVKASGFGRELGKFGFHEFANQKLYRWTARV